MEYLSFGVELINNLKVHKFSLLCEQIFIGLTEGKEISALFTVQEHKKLQTMFSLHPNKLNMLLDAIIYVFQQLAYIKTMKAIHHFLIKSALSEEHIACIGTIWKEKGADYVAKLKEKRVCVDNTLKSFNFVLNLPLSQNTLDINVADSQSQTETIQAQDFVDIDSKAPIVDYVFNIQSSSREQEEKYTLQMNKTQVQDFFQNLEQIQIKLDELTH